MADKEKKAVQDSKVEKATTDEAKAAEQYIIKLPNRENKSLYLGVFYYRLLITILKTLPIES